MEKLGRRRMQWRRAAMLAAASAGLLAAAISFPLPAGWAVRAALERAFPPEGAWSVSLARATFEWRWASRDLRLRLGGLELRHPAGQGVAVAALVLSFEKQRLLSGFLAPSRIEAVGVRVAASLRPPPEPAIAPPPNTRGSAPASATAGQLDRALARLLPAGDGVRISIHDLRTTVETRDGPFDPGAGAITALVRHGVSGLELAGELAGAGFAPARIRFGATLPFRESTVALRLHAPAIDLRALPAWPGVAALPVSGRVDLAARVELDPRSPATLRGEGRIGLTEAAFESALFAQPLPFQSDLRLTFAGEPLRVSLAASRLDATGASLEIRAAALEWGEEPRLEWEVSATGRGDELRRSLHSAPPEPWLAAADAAVVSGNSTGIAAVYRDAAGDWNLRHATVRGEVEVRGTGDPWRIRGSAEKSPAEERVRAGVEVEPLMPGTWFEGNVAHPLAALRLPVGAQLEAEWTPRGELVSAGGRIALGAGEVQWPGLPGRAVPVRHGEILATVDPGARTLRIASARVEFAGPVMSARDVELRLDADDVLRITGEAQLENLSGRWVAPRLSRDQRAALRLLGRLRWAELTLDRCRVAGALGIALRTGGGATLHSSTAGIELAARVKAAPVTLTGGVTLSGGSDDLHLAFALSDLRIAPWELTLSDAIPPVSAWDFPLDLGVRARANLTRGVEEATVTLRAGPGVLRGWKAYGRDLPLQSLMVEAGASDRFQRFAVPRLEAEVGDGVRLTGRNLSWDATTPSRVGGELEILPCSATALGALLPESVATLAGPWLRAGKIEGVRLGGRARADSAARTGWVLEDASVRAAASDLAGEVDGLGTVKVGRVEVEADHPRAAVRFLRVAAPGVHAGDVDVLLNVDARDFAAPRAQGILAAGRMRFAAETQPEAVPIAAPVAFALELTGSELRFDFTAPDVLGLPVQVRDGRVQAGGAGEPFRLQLPQCEIGRTRLGALVRGGAGRMALDVTGRYVDAEEMLGVLWPLVRARPAVRPAVAGAASTARPVAGDALRFDFSAQIDEVRFSAERSVREIELSGRADVRGLSNFQVRAREGGGNTLTASLRADGEGRRVVLQAADASAWIETLTAPLSRAAGGSALDATVAQIRQIPQLVGGGAIDVTGQLLDEARFAGQVQVQQVRVLRPPRVLQLLSLKAGRSWGTQPVIERLSIDRLTLAASAVELQNLVLAGSGLVNRLKVESGHYQTASEQLAIVGEYFGVGFEIDGTRGEPQVFLKDSNLLVRTLGQRNEFDFDAMAREPAKAPAR